MTEMIHLCHGVDPDLISGQLCSESLWESRMLAKVLRVEVQYLFPVNSGAENIRRVFRRLLQTSNLDRHLSRRLLLNHELTDPPSNNSPPFASMRSLAVSETAAGRDTAGILIVTRSRSGKLRDWITAPIFTVRHGWLLQLPLVRLLGPV